jgi:hypothetical protein
MMKHAIKPWVIRRLSTLSLPLSLASPLSSPLPLSLPLPLPQYPEIFDHAYMGMSDMDEYDLSKLPRFHRHDFNGYFLDTDLHFLVYTTGEKTLHEIEKTTTTN